MDENNEMNLDGLMDEFVMIAVESLLDTMDESGMMSKLAHVLYAHKMPVREIIPFIRDYAQILEETKKAE